MRGVRRPHPPGPISRFDDHTASGVLRLTFREAPTARDQYGNVHDAAGQFWDRCCCDAVRVLLGFDCLYAGDRPHASSDERKKVA